MARSSFNLTTFFTLSLITLTHALDSCPANPVLKTDGKGVQFQICPNSDIQVPSINIVNDISNVDACFQLCSTTAGCKKAVYSPEFRICHIKGNPTNAPWVASNNYDAIQYIQTLVDGSQISTSCPVQENITTSADGTKVRICPMSDFQSNTLSSSSVKDITSCAALCTQTTGCTKAVFDHVDLLCHIKGNPTVFKWVVNLGRFDTIIVIRQAGSTAQSLQSTAATTSATQIRSSTTTLKSSQTTQISITSPTTSQSAPCPSGVSTFVMDDGTLYEICPKSDYTGSSVQVVGGILSTWNCLQLCNTNAATCIRAVYISKTFTCHLKGNDTVFTTPSDYDSIRYVNRTKYQPSPNIGLGSWSAPIQMPIIPVAAYVVPAQPVSNRVSMFSSWGPDDFSGATGMTQFADFNWQSKVVSQRTITNTGHDMFCPGISSLQDGRVAITGGQNAEVTSYYDPASDSFIRGPNMKLARGYQSSATLSTGGIFTIGGSFNGGIGGKVGEILDPKGTQWTLLPGADVTPLLTTDHEGAWRTDNHAWLYGWKDGSVFQAGPSKQQHWYSTQGSGSVANAAVRDSANDAMSGINVMYDAVAGQILSAGGSQDYTDSDAFVRAHITTINKPFAGSIVERVADMKFARGFANAVVLPDGTVLVTGGQKRSAVFTDTDSALAPELFNPITKTWKTLSAARIPRNYHSVSLLLADGTVFTGGGGMCPQAYNQDDSWCIRAKDHPSAEIFSPPYLFNADGSFATRPVISTLSSPTSASGLYASVGGTLNVVVNDTPAATFALVRLGSATHSMNSDQRRIPISNVQKNQAQYTFKLPSDSGILIPGYYYLFAISQAGVPSIARTIQILV